MFLSGAERSRRTTRRTRTRGHQGAYTTHHTQHTHSIFLSYFSIYFGVFTGRKGRARPERSYGICCKSTNLVLHDKNQKFNIVFGPHCDPYVFLQGKAGSPGKRGSPGPPVCPQSIDTVNFSVLYITDCKTPFSVPSGY